MNTCRPFLTLAAALLMVLSQAVGAGAFDATQTITGTVERLIEINRQRIIDNVNPDTVGMPRTFVIDLQKGTLRGAPDSLVRRMVRIKRVEHVEDKLILLGADEGTAGTTSGLGWSMAIEKTTGRATLSASGNGTAYVAFGTCTPVR